MFDTGIERDGRQKQNQNYLAEGQFTLVNCAGAIRPKNTDSH